MNSRATAPPSMNSHPETPEQRRARLLARSAELRQQLRQQSQVLEPPLRWAERGVELLRWARARRGPLLVAGLGLGLGAAFVLRRPTRAIGLAGGLWSLWGMVRRAAPLLQLAARLQQPPRQR
jgi:YqjK-like protein